MGPTPPEWPPAQASSPPPIRPLGILDAFVDGARMVLRPPLGLLGANTLALLAIAVLTGASLIPFAALVTVPLLLTLAGPLSASLSHLGLRSRIGERVRTRDLLPSLRSTPPSVVGLFLLLLLFSALGVAAGVALFHWGITTGSQAGELTPKATTLLVSGYLVTLGLGLTPWAFLGFAPELVACRGLQISEALALSREKTLTRPLRSLVFAALCAALLLTGLLLGGVGLLLTSPWVVATRARMHEELFGPLHAPAR